MSNYTYRPISHCSTGNEALDSLIGIGSASLIHSLILFDENGTNERYCNSLQRCFIAEGLVNDQIIFVAGPSIKNTIEILENLPVKKEDVENLDQCKNNNTNDENFKIAWRYQTTPRHGTSFTTDGKEYHKFDFSKKHNAFQKFKNKIFIFDENNILLQPSLKELWKQIYPLITNTKKDGLRIVINHLSSPIWDDLDYLPFFLTQLKAFCRYTNVIVLISLDSLLLKTGLFNICLQYVDAAFRLQSMDKNDQIQLHLNHKIDRGRFFILKLPSISSASPMHIPPIRDLLFLLRNNIFELETLHLPPAFRPDEETSEYKNKHSYKSLMDQF